MEVRERTLRIHVVNAPLLSLSDCEVLIRASLPADSDVSIEQAALQARLTGDYGAVRIKGHAADRDEPNASGPAKARRQSAMP